MKANQSYTCASCVNILTVKGSQSVLLICPACAEIIVNETGREIVPRKMPEDWSVIQIGTTGQYKMNSFEVIGRIRLQLRSTYLNHWCVWFEKEKKYSWLAEAYGSFSVFAPAIVDMRKKEELRMLRAGNSLTVHESYKLTVHAIDKCEWLSYEGELCHWKNFVPGFFTAYARNNNGIVADFHVVAQEDVAYFMVGESVAAGQLALQKTRAWSEW